jgi:hypothetical protein
MYLLKSKYEINNFYKSPLKHKKYRVALVNKLTCKIVLMDFGDKRYQHYKDSTPIKLYSNLDHNDKNRRRLYKARHKHFIKPNHYSPGYFSMKYLW